MKLIDKLNFLTHILLGIFFMGAGIISFWAEDLLTTAILFALGFLFITTSGLDNIETRIKELEETKK